MAQYRKLFRCEVLTPCGPVCSVDAAGVVMPAADGQLGVLAERAPLVALMGCGRLIIEPGEGAAKEYYVAGGFAQTHRSVLTILAEECVALERLDPEAIWSEIQNARSMPLGGAEAVARRAEALKAARAKFRIAQEYRGKRPGEVPGTGPE